MTDTTHPVDCVPCYYLRHFGPVHPRFYEEIHEPGAWPEDLLPGPQGQGKEPRSAMEVSG